MSEAHKEAARRRGEARSAGIDAKVRAAMRLMQSEILANQGEYPSNGGAVSMNEVARRAGISETTLFSPKQKELGKEVKTWIQSLKADRADERPRARRTGAERAEDWRKLFHALETQHILLELELQDARVQLDVERKKLVELARKYEVVLEQLKASGTGKIRVLTTKGARE